MSRESFRGAGGEGGRSATSIEGGTNGEGKFFTEKNATGPSIGWETFSRDGMKEKNRPEKFSLRGVCEKGGEPAQQ